MYLGSFGALLHTLKMQSAALGAEPILWRNVLIEEQRLDSREIGKGRSLRVVPLAASTARSRLLARR